MGASLKRGGGLEELLLCRVRTKRKRRNEKKPKKAKTDSMTTVDRGGKEIQLWGKGMHGKQSPAGKMKYVTADNHRKYHCSKN